MWADFITLFYLITVPKRSKHIEAVGGAAHRLKERINRELGLECGGRLVSNRKRKIDDAHVSWTSTGSPKFWSHQTMTELLKAGAVNAIHHDDESIQIISKPKS